MASKLVTLDNLERFATNCKATFATKADETSFITGVTGANDTLTVSKKDGTSATLTINNVANATKATQDADGNVITETYATKDDVAKFAKALKYKGSVATYAELPTTGNEIGDVWNVQTADKTHGIKAGEDVCWNGESWDNLGGICDMSEYAKKSELATVSTTGSYNDLEDKPTIPSEYTLPTATATTLGGIKIGTDLKISNGVVNVSHATSADSATKATQDASGNVITTTYATKASLATVATSGSYNDLLNKPEAYSLPIATASVLGGVKAGSDVSISTEGVLSVTHATAADKATKDGDGNVIKDTYVKTADITTATDAEIDALFD